MSFDSDSFSVDESSGEVNVQVVRSGDIDIESSVICFTSPDSALEGQDFVGRSQSEESRIVFLPGEKVNKIKVLFLPSLRLNLMLFA